MQICDLQNMQIFDLQNMRIFELQQQLITFAESAITGVNTGAEVGDRVVWRQLLGWYTQFVTSRR
eukprot:SAG11_NODE_9810_length_879_cov_1.279487_1_plen_65_part_00